MSNYDPDNHDLNKNSDHRNRQFKIGIVCGILLFLVLAPIVFLISVVHAFISVHDQGLSSNKEWLSSALEAIGWAKSFSIITAIVGLLLFVISAYLFRKNRMTTSQTD